ncbi:MAG: hypothetical protein WA364_28670 [Candidatus Nitrosopolaris sp.]
MTPSCAVASPPIIDTQRGAAIIATITADASIYGIGEGGGITSYSMMRVLACMLDQETMYF